MTGHIVSHLARRGMQHMHEHYSKKWYVERLEQDAQLYEDAGPEGRVDPKELWPVFVTAIIAILIIWSVRSLRQVRLAKWRKTNGIYRSIILSDRS